jgi:hypothetical protein
MTSFFVTENAVGLQRFSASAWIPPEFRGLADWNSGFRMVNIDSNSLLDR